MIVLYYQIKTLIDIWCKWKIESQIFYSTIGDFTSLANWNPRPPRPFLSFGFLSIALGIFKIYYGTLLK